MVGQASCFAREEVDGLTTMIMIQTLMMVPITSNVDDLNDDLESRWVG